MNSPLLRGKNVLVVGLARSGAAAANFLQRQGARVCVTDSKPAAALTDSSCRLEGNPRLVLGRHDAADFVHSDLIVISPGVPSDIPPIRLAREAGVPVWSEVELAYRFLSGPVIGVTGSNGKTTTTALIGAMFQQAGAPCTVAGNIGTALTGTLDQGRISSRTWVVELSSFQLENIHRFRCRIAVLLNLSPDHQDRYPTFEDYQSAKARIFENQTSEDFCVANADDPLVGRLVSAAAARRVWFSRRQLPDRGAGLEAGEICWNWEGRRQGLLPASEMALKGNHNLENALAAVAAARLSDLPVEAIAEALRTFPGVEHRLEWVRNFAGVDYYNDSKATNVDSARVALQAFEGPLVVILGGLDKGQDFAPLVELLERKSRAVVLIGETAERLQQALGSRVRQYRAESLESAVEIAAELAQPADCVLLAPACASFDMFQNFEHRGRVFKEAVRSLPPARGRCC